MKTPNPRGPGEQHGINSTPPWWLGPTVAPAHPARQRPKNLVKGLPDDAFALSVALWLPSHH